MKNLNMRSNGDTWEILGYPDAIAIVETQGQITDELKSIALHQQDLLFALEALKIITTIPETNRILRYSAWETAINRYFKCFKKSKARKKLDKEIIYSSFSNGLEAFKYFENLRDKHIVHDENSYSQAHVGLIINKENHSSKIADAFANPIISGTLDNDHYTGLYQLVSIAVDWINPIFEKLHYDLVQEYNKYSYEELIQLNKLQFTVPTAQDISQTRKK